MDHTRRKFLSRLLGGSAVIALAGATGCVGTAAVGGGEGPVEVLPLRDGLWYANTMPTSVPPVRYSPAVAPDWSNSKSFE
jgi:hypothetical protein